MLTAIGAEALGVYCRRMILQSQVPDWKKRLLSSTWKLVLPASERRPGRRLREPRCIRTGPAPRYNPQPAMMTPGNVTIGR
jgi:hypothetical protein